MYVASHWRMAINTHENHPVGLQFLPTLEAQLWTNKQKGLAETLSGLFGSTIFRDPSVPYKGRGTLQCIQRDMQPYAWHLGSLSYYYYFSQKKWCVQGFRLQSHTWVQFQLYHLLVVWPWPSYLTSVCLSFLMSTWITTRTSDGVLHIWKALTTVPGKCQAFVNKYYNYYSYYLDV